GHRVPRESGAHALRRRSGADVRECLPLRRERATLPARSSPRLRGSISTLNPRISTGASKLSTLRCHHPIVRAVFIAALAGTVFAANAVAAAEPSRETRALSGFSRIDIDGEVDVTLRQGEKEAVTIEAPAQALPHIHTEVHDRTLVISPGGQRRWWDFVLG